MAQVMNFKRMEVSGKTKEEALAKAPFEIMGSADQAYNAWRKKQTSITESDRRQFMLDYLAKKSKNVPGVGFYITLESAVNNTREHAYTIEDVKNELGARTWGTVFEFVDDETNAVIAKTEVNFVPKVDKIKDDEGNVIREEPVTDEEGNPVMVMKTATKAEAKDLGRSLYTEKDYCGNLTCYMKKDVIVGQNVAFRMKYTPSKSARNGSYIVFGLERD